MKFSTASYYALCGATAVSARPGSCKKHHDPLELDHFGNFTMISLQDAKAGILMSHNGTTHKIPDYPSSGYPTSAVSGTTYTAGPGHSSSMSSASAGASSSASSASSGHFSSPSSTSSGVSSFPLSTLSGSSSSVIPTASGSSSSSLSGSSSFATSTASGSSSSSLSSTLSSLTASQTLAVDVQTPTSSTPAVSSTAAATCEQRTEWRSYSDTDRHAFAAALKCLKDSPASGDYSPSRNRYEDIVRVHQMMTSTIHGNNIFLFWHRYYVWTLEQIMKEECGFVGTFPWWDETLDAGNFAGSSIFTADFFGSLPASTGGSGTCITDGYFANTVCHIGPGTGFQDHCLSRAVDETLTAQCSEDFVTTCNSRPSYPDMENCAELGPHGYGHNGIGSVMADVSASPSDPTFFLHHLFIDRNFWLWQEIDPSTRKSQISGCIDNNSPCTPLTLDTVITVQGLRPDVTVRDIIDSENGAMCYSYSY